MKQDYQIAGEEAETLFASLNIQTTISEPMAGVDKDWPHIAYSLTFQRGDKYLTSTYRMGVGHVNWKEGIRRLGQSCMIVPIQFEPLFFTLQKHPSAISKDKMLHAQAAVWLAKRQKVQPKPYEVLACVCEEALTASENTFENWASEFGYDTDSRKAERLFHQCREPYGALLNLIGIKNIRKFAELRSRF